MKHLLTTLVIFACMSAGAQNDVPVVSWTSDVSTTTEPKITISKVTVGVRVQTIHEIQDQRHWLADGPGKCGFGPSAELLPVIDTTRHKNPYPDSDIGLYTEGDCYEASNVLQSWAWGTWESIGKEWIQVGCPPCLLECVARDGTRIPCKCYRIVVTRIANFNPLPVQIRPVVKTVYRA